MKILKGKIAIITGGTRGIGKSIVELFVNQGAKVHFTYNSSFKEAQKIKKTLGCNVQCYHLDSTDEIGTNQFVEKVIKDDGKINIIINNAGIARDNLLLRMTYKDWQEVLHTNLTSCFFLTKSTIKFMLQQKSGSIINISSVIGLIGNIGQTNYAASKSGIIGFTKSIAKEFGSRNIRCNAIAPGVIMTDMISMNKKLIEIWIKKIPLKKIGTTIDVAKAALFLASDLSSYITSEVLNVNGGIY